MIRRFKLEFEVVLDTDSESVAIARARESYGQLLEPASGTADLRREMPLPEDFIQQADEALLQLFDTNPLLSNAGAVQPVYCLAGPEIEVAGRLRQAGVVAAALEFGVNGREGGAHWCQPKHARGHLSGGGNTASYQYVRRLPSPGRLIPSASMHYCDYDLKLYLLGMLDEPELSSLREHLLLCEECRQHLAGAAEHIRNMRRSCAT